MIPVNMFTSVMLSPEEFLKELHMDNIELPDSPYGIGDVIQFKYDTNNEYQYGVISGMCIRYKIFYYNVRLHGDARGCEITHKHVTKLIRKF